MLQADHSLYVKSFQADFFLIIKKLQLLLYRDEATSGLCLSTSSRREWRYKFKINCPLIDLSYLISMDCTVVVKPKKHLVAVF